ncbi:MAG: GNAT family protein [Bacteriovorax sp.]|nr:GNAT family protein [Bacteriovorax sp.]
MEKTYSIKTKRLIIRPLNETDYEMWKDAYISMLPPQNKWDQANSKPTSLKKSDFKKILTANKKNRKNESNVDYAIIDRKSKKYIGRVGFMSFIRSITQSAFLGYSLFNNHWGKGYAEEAVGAAIEIAFTKHKLHRVQAGIEADNKRSLRLAKKLKMRREGVAKNVVKLRGEWRDLVQFALTCEDRR